MQTIFTELDESAGAILKWVFKQLDGDEIEDVTDEILDKLVNGELEPAGTIYCKKNYFNLLHQRSSHVL